MNFKSFGNIKDWRQVPELYLGWTVDGDQFAGGLLIDTSYTDNYLEVTRYDPLTKEIDGRSERHLSKAEVGNPASIGMPTTMHITDGRFYLKLE